MSTETATRSRRCCSRSGATCPIPGRRRRTRPRRSTRRASRTSGRARDARVIGSSPSLELYEWELPYAKWFVGGKLNVTYNCVDRHVENGLGERVAYFWEGEASPTTAARSRTRNSQAEVAARERPEGARRRQGDSGRDLHGHLSPSCPWRCSPARGSARRTPSCSAASPRTCSRGGCNDMGCEVLVTQDEGLAPRPARAAEEERRRGSRDLPVGARCIDTAEPAATSP